MSMLLPNGNFFSYLHKIFFQFKKKRIVTEKKKILGPPYWPQFWPPAGQEKKNMLLRVASRQFFFGEIWE